MQMNTEIEKELHRRELEEKNLQFTHFSNEDALKVGLTVADLAAKRSGAVVIEIVVNGNELFHYNMPGSNPRQCAWVKKKANMVFSAQMSSLHAGQFLEASGKDLWEDWRCSDAEYATIGGGFPIILKGTGIIGSLCCSGLPHTEDHRLLVDAVAEYLGADPYREA